MLENTRTKYGNVSKAFHWGMSIIIICLLIAGSIMINLEDGDTKWQIYTVHKSFGLIILALIPIRFAWKLRSITPTLAMVPRWQKLTARSIHWLLYLAMFTMPMSGWIMATASGNPPNFFWLFELPAPVPQDERLAEIALNIHYYAAWTLAIMLVIHLGIAIKAHFFDKNNILARMLPGENQAPGAQRPTQTDYQPPVHPDDD